MTYFFLQNSFLIIIYFQEHRDRKDHRGPLVELEQQDQEETEGPLGHLAQQVPQVDQSISICIILKCQETEPIVSMKVH